jgi:hypothetical protein
MYVMVTPGAGVTLESAMRNGKFARKGPAGWRIAFAGSSREIGGVSRSSSDPAYLVYRFIKTFTESI